MGLKGCGKEIFSNFLKSLVMNRSKEETKAESEQLKSINSINITLFF